MPTSGFFEGKTALITGGSKRLGRATALALAGAGAHVAIHYNRSGEAAEGLAEELREQGVRAGTFHAELGDPSAVEALLPQVWEAMYGVDFLVNNASIFPTGRLDDLTLEEVHGNLRVNSWAPFLLTRALWRKMRGSNRRGSVVNLLDTRLRGGDPAHAAYDLSKAVLNELTMLTALEFAPEVRVNGVAPGAVLPPEEHDEAYLETLTEHLPLKRRGYPRDIADATLYLLGAGFVTGQIIYVDGGRHIRPGDSP